MLTEEQLNKIVSDATDEIKTQIVRQAKEQIQRQIGGVVYKALQTTVSEFVVNEFAPELKDLLLEEKPMILKAAAQAASQIADALTAGLVQDVKGNLASSYKRQALLKTLFT